MDVYKYFQISQTSEDKMKTILSLFMVLSLTGCSTLLSLWPTPHDPAAFDNLVSVKIAVDKLSCDDKNWTDAETKIKIGRAHV